MTRSAAPETPANPFSTKFIRPGSIPFLFPEGSDPITLLNRMKATRWRGQIIGAHGSGKTSLLLALKPHLEAQRRTVWYRPEPGTKKLQLSVVRQVRFWERELLVIIDGFSELPLTSQFAVLFGTWWKSNGLLVTTHRRQPALPILLTLQPEPETFLAIVNLIVSQSQKNAAINVTREELTQIFLKHGGNIREALFNLFDRAVSTAQCRQ